MDFRSLYLHFENGVLLMNTMTVQDVKKDFLETVQISEAVDKDFRNGFWWGLVSSVFRIIAPMM